MFETSIDTGFGTDKSTETGSPAQHDQRAGDEQTHAASHQCQLCQRTDAGTNGGADGTVDVFAMGEFKYVAAMHPARFVVSHDGEMYVRIALP